MANDKFSEMRAAKGYLSDEWACLDATPTPSSEKWVEQNNSAPKMSERWVEMNPKGDVSFSNKWQEINNKNDHSAYRMPTSDGDRSVGMKDMGKFKAGMRHGRYSGGTSESGGTNF